MKLEKLVGKTVTKILMAPGENYMQFVCANGDRLMFTTDADCCSETWFADIVGVEALLCSLVVSAEEVEVPPLGDDDRDARSRQGYDSLYGFNIKTAKGQCDVVYRNSSNGYYGGSCEVLLNGETDRWHDTPEVSDDWKEITEDFSA